MIDRTGGVDESRRLFFFSFSVCYFFFVGSYTTVQS